MSESKLSERTQNLFGWGFSVVLTLVLLELAGAVLIHGGWYPARPPTYRPPEPREPFLVDIDPHFGGWHVANSSRAHARACFHTVYRSNDHGAVDVPRSRRAEAPRVVVVGDSFVVGHGVPREERFSDVLERDLGVPHLNFGVGGSGPLQYLLRYQHLARGFDHDAVVVGILPDNDFRDDEPDPEATRYEPYLAGAYPDYEVRYTLDRVEASSRHPTRFSAPLTEHEWLKSYSYAYSVADWFVAHRKHRAKIRDEAGAYSGYFDFTPEQLDRLRWVLEGFREAADERPIIVALIPRLRDLQRVASAGENPLVERLAPLAETVGVTLVDLLPSFAEDDRGRWEDLYLACDGHWSPVGHAAAARVLAPRVREALSVRTSTPAQSSSN